MKKEQKQQLQQQTECCKSIEQQRHQQHKKGTRKNFLFRKVHCKQERQTATRAEF